MNESTVNLNAADCIKETSNFGGTVYHNICNESVTNVPWGSADWVAVVIGFGFAALLMALFLFLSGLLLKTAFE